MLLEENENGKENSDLRNGSGGNGPGRRRRPPPADFAPFDSSESHCRHRNDASESSESKKSSFKNWSLMTWHDIPGIDLSKFSCNFGIP